jgi:AraC-like DNA-binding protein
MLTSVIDIINYITIFQLFLFSIYFFFKKQGYSLSNKLLALFFLANALQILTYYFNFRYIIFFLQYIPQLVWSVNFFAFSIGPLIYLYTLSQVRNNFKIKPLHYLLFIPFAAFGYLCITHIIIQSPDTIRKIVKSGIFISYELYAIFYAVMRLMNLILAVIAISALINYKRKVKILKSTHRGFDYDWFFIVLIGTSLVFIIEAINYVYAIMKNNYSTLYQGVHFVKFIVFNGLIFSGIKNSLLFEANKVSVKYSKSQLKDDEKATFMKNLKELMETEKYFLTPSITVQDIANKLNTNSKYISQVINELYGQNFLDFVNSYRIEEAKKMFSDPRYKGYSILGISLESGFTSKSAFNAAFKKFTNGTPSDYKKANFIHNQY